MSEQASLTLLSRPVYRAPEEERRAEKEEDGKERGAAGGGSDSHVSQHSYVTESTARERRAELTRFPWMNLAPM